VLVKVGRTGHIPDEQIARGLEWVLTNKKKYDIRVVKFLPAATLSCHTWRVRCASWLSARYD
jgi:hypothetical protein